MNGYIDQAKQATLCAAAASSVSQSVRLTQSVLLLGRSVGVNRAFSVHVLDGVVDCNEESEGGREGQVRKGEHNKRTSPSLIRGR